MSASPSTKVAAVQEVRIGGRSNDPTEAVHDIVGAFVFTDGRVMIADGSRRQIIFYDAEGRKVSAVGGEGEGPGEFRQMETVARLRGDSIAVWDAQLDRLTVLSSHGELGRIRSVPEAGGAAQAWFLSDGRLVLEDGLSGYESIEDQGRLGGETTLIVLDPENDEVVKIGPVTGTELFVYHGSVLLRAFGTRLMVAPYENSVVAGSGKDTVIRYGVDGETREPVWTPPPSSAVTDATVERYCARRLAEVSGPQRPALREALSAMPMGETIPSYSDLRVDRLGRVWLRAYTLKVGEPDQWYIVDEDRSLSVDLPRGAEWLDAGRNYVLLLERDALDLEQVSLYKLGPGAE